MGFRVILLIIAFLIIFGGIIVFLSQKQIEGKEDLSESVFQKQAQQLANNAVQEGIKRLRQNFDDAGGNLPGGGGGSGGNLVFTLPEFTDSKQGDYTVHCQAVSTYDNRPLPENEYAIVANATVYGEDGLEYKARTVGTYALRSEFHHYFEPDIDWGTITGRIFIIFRANAVEIYETRTTGEQLYSINSNIAWGTDRLILLRSYSTTPQNNELAAYDNTIYIHGNMMENFFTIGCWPVATGNAGSTNSNAELGWNHRNTNFSQTNPTYITLNYPIRLILETNVPTRIGSHMNTTPAAKTQGGIVIESNRLITSNHWTDIQSNGVFYSRETIVQPPYLGADKAMYDANVSEVNFASNVEQYPNLATLPGGELSLSEKKDYLKSWKEYPQTKP